MRSGSIEFTRQSELPCYCYSSTTYPYIDGGDSSMGCQPAGRYEKHSAAAAATNRKRSLSSLKNQLPLGTTQQYSSPAPTPPPQVAIDFEREGICNHWCIKWIINMRCTENSIWVMSLYYGVVILAMQITPIFLMDWLHVTEPRGINASDENGEQLEAPFTYQTGYLHMCRWLDGERVDDRDELGLSADEWARVVGENTRSCVLNSVYTGEDLIEFSFATSAIMSRLVVPMILHVAGTGLSLLALLLSVAGHVRKDAMTIYSGIVFTLAGLVISIAILQVICIVDDEMLPRMKPNAAGEPSQYSFKYGISFFATALSFLPIQMCIYLQTTIYFKRYGSPADKAKVVPGLDFLPSVEQVPATFRSGAGFTPARGQPLVSAGSTVVVSPGHVSGVGVRFAGRRRESRLLSKDFDAFGIQQEVDTINPMLSGSFNMRRPSIQLSL